YGGVLPEPRFGVRGRADVRPDGPAPGRGLAVGLDHGHGLLPGRAPRRLLLRLRFDPLARRPAPGAAPLPAALRAPARAADRRPRRLAAAGRGQPDPVAVGAL